MLRLSQNQLDSALSRTYWSSGAHPVEIHVCNRNTSSYVPRLFHRELIHAAHTCSPYMQPIHAAHTCSPYMQRVCFHVRNINLKISKRKTSSVVVYCRFCGSAMANLSDLVAFALTVTQLKWRI